MHAPTLSRAALLDLLQQLIRIPSVNPKLAPDESAGEAAIAEFARDWLQARGVGAVLEEVAPGRPNLVAELGHAEGPALILCAHLDTVSASEMEIAPFEPRVDGKRVYGRGSYDMKGGVAAIMAAAAALVDEDLQGKVMLALVVDEEHYSIGADDFVKRHRADACIVTEPTEGRLGLTHKGFVWGELTTHGVAAHGSRWDLGVSAIGKMGRIIAALERFDADTLRSRTHPQLGPASLHCSLIRGGSGISTYAPDCRLKVERRTLPGETLDVVKAELEEVVREAGEEAGIDCFFHRTPLVCPPDAPIAHCVRDAARDVTGREPENTGVGYWADSAVFAAAGIPTLLYGPAGQGAHGAVEWVDLDSVVNCAKVLAETAHRLSNYY
ncbi:MAG TPA: M20/M25/M40 family metallo-hydrolase [Gemmatimonadota bacterium]|nr:M20/M25/M40 family metallo-hydrolase [Gemmatimonadota bacterium]